MVPVDFYLVNMLQHSELCQFIFVELQVGLILVLLYCCDREEYNINLWYDGERKNSCSSDFLNIVYYVLASVQEYFLASVVYGLSIVSYSYSIAILILSLFP